MAQRKSKLNKRVQEEYESRMKTLDLEEKISQLEETINLLRQFFEAGLSYKGFSKAEIREIWMEKRNR